MLPLRNENYIPQGDLLHQLEKKLNKTHFVVIGGIFGSGKKQLALEFAHTFLEDPVEGKNRRVFWHDNNSPYIHTHLGKNLWEHEALDKIHAQTRDGSDWLLIYQMPLGTAELARDFLVKKLRFTCSKVIIIAQSQRLWKEHPYITVNWFDVPSTINFFTNLIKSARQPKQDNLESLIQKSKGLPLYLKKAAEEFLQQGKLDIEALIKTEIKTKIEEIYEKEFPSIKDSIKRALSLICFLKCDAIPDFLITGNAELYKAAQALVDCHLLTRRGGFYFVNSFIRKILTTKTPAIAILLDWTTGLEKKLQDANKALNDQVTLEKAIADQGMAANTAKTAESDLKKAEELAGIAKAAKKKAAEKKVEDTKKLSTEADAKLTKASQAATKALEDIQKNDSVDSLDKLKDFAKTFKEVLTPVIQSKPNENLSTEKISAILKALDDVERNLIKQVDATADTIESPKLTYAQVCIYDELFRQIRAKLAKASGIDQRLSKGRASIKTLQAISHWLPAVTVNHQGPAVTVNTKDGFIALGNVLDDYLARQEATKKAIIKDFFVTDSLRGEVKTSAERVGNIAEVIVSMFSNQIMRLSDASIKNHFSVFAVKRMLDHIGSNRYSFSKTTQEVLIEGLFLSDKCKKEKLETVRPTYTPWTASKIFRTAVRESKDAEFRYMPFKNRRPKTAICGYRKFSPREKLDKRPDPAIYTKISNKE